MEKMEKMENTNELEQLLKDGANSLNVSLSDVHIKAFMDYMEICLKWNENVNLTAITDPRDFVIKHFLDSLTIMKFVDKPLLKLIDVGTGAGFPGLPLKILAPEIDLTLLDSLNKRITFLNHLTEQLNINDVKTVHMRAEDACKSALYRSKFDISVSRAVANLTTLAQYCLPLVKIGGKFISMKGSDIKDELNAAKDTIKALGGELSDVVEITLPNSDIKHTLIVVNKLKHVPIEIPKKAKKSTKTTK